MRRRDLSRLTIAGVALALLAGTAPAAVAGSDRGQNNGGDRSKGHHRPAYKNIGYFTQWGVYGRDFQVNDLQTSGSAAKLTHINYAFGNVNAEGKCFTGNIPGQADAWADYARPLDAANSVDGVADTDTQPLAGNFNQLRELKAKNPGLKVMISLGGWSYSTNFSDSVRTAASARRSSPPASTCTSRATSRWTGRAAARARRPASSTGSTSTGSGPARRATRAPSSARRTRRTSRP